MTLCGTLGADLHPAATPGLVEGGNEFYTVPGAEVLRGGLADLDILRSGAAQSDGVISLAQITQAPIIPVSYDVSRKITVNSWDNFMVPLPFARATLRIGAPIAVPAELDPPRGCRSQPVKPLALADGERRPVQHLGNNLNEPVGAVVQLVGDEAGAGGYHDRIALRGVRALLQQAGSQRRHRDDHRHGREKRWKTCRDSPGIFHPALRAGRSPLRRRPLICNRVG